MKNEDVIKEKKELRPKMNKKWSKLILDDLMNAYNDEMNACNDNVTEEECAENVKVIIENFIKSFSTSQLEDVRGKRKK